MIPTWIKNVAGWWADNLIDNQTYFNALQWLIDNNILIIS